MFLLIQWMEKPYQVTVMEEPDCLKEKNEGEIVEINYPDKGIFKGHLIQRSESKSYLDKLSKSINKDGTIKVNNKKKVNKKLKILTEEEKAHKKLKNKMREKTNKILEKHISKLQPICGQKSADNVDEGESSKQIPLEKFKELNQLHLVQNSTKDGESTLTAQEIENQIENGQKSTETVKEGTYSQQVSSRKKKKLSKIHLIQKISENEKNSGPTFESQKPTNQIQNGQKSAQTVDRARSSKQISLKGRKELTQINSIPKIVNDVESTSTSHELQNEIENGQKSNKTVHEEKRSKPKSSRKRKQLRKIHSIQKIANDLESTVDLQITENQIENEQKSAETVDQAESSKQSLSEKKELEQIPLIPKNANDLKSTSTSHELDDMRDGLNLEDNNIIGCQNAVTNTSNNYEQIFENITPDIVILFEKLAICAKKALEDKLGSTSVTKELNKEVKSSSSNLTNLVDGCNILIDKDQLFLMKRYRHDPRELTRQLLLELLGAEKLRKMTALGKKGNGIPSDIRLAVFKYVKLRNKEFTEPEFIITINNQCGTLRHPKVNKTDKKLTNKNDQEDDKKMETESESGNENITGTESDTDQETENETETEIEADTEMETETDQETDNEAEVSKKKKRKLF